MCSEMAKCLLLTIAFCASLQVVLTTVESVDFDVRQSAAQLQKAMAGWGTDEQTLINIISKHSLHQRKQIAHYYKTAYGEKLQDDISSETSGSFKIALLSLLMSPEELNAYFLRYAMLGAGTDERLLYVILASVPTAGHMEKLVSFYKHKYQSSLLKDISGEVDGLLEDFLLTLTNSFRQEEGWVDENLAKKDAMDLAGLLSSTLPKYIFNNVFSSRSFQQLRKTFQIFMNLTSQDIRSFIKNKYSGDYKEALICVADYALSPVNYFTSWLHRSLNSGDTNILTWILVRQQQTNLNSVKKRYLETYGRSLESHVTVNTRGDYRTLLLNIITSSENIY